MIGDGEASAASCGLSGGAFGIAWPKRDRTNPLGVDPKSLGRRLRDVVLHEFLADNDTKNNPDVGNGRN